MALRIRLTREGTKSKPHKKIVVIGGSKDRDADFIEQIGFYNPKFNPPLVKLNRERANYWIKMGAKPTNTVKSIIKKEGIYPVRESSSR